MKRIAVVTTSRADYGHLYWPMREIEEHPDLSLDLIVTGAHLSTTFGRTVDVIEADGFDIRARVECLDPEDSDAGMARTIGTATTGLTKVLAGLRPDILLLIADRYEMLAPASVALALRIPIAHIEGGDVSEGAIDDAVRNALTKMAHLHFTPTELARQRVLAMGEESWRVVCSGAPSLDHLRLSTRPDLGSLEAALGQTLTDQLCVVAYHPVTLQQDTTLEADALFAALATWQHQIIFCFPNADAGSSELARRARAFCAAREDATLYVNLDHLTYWALLERAQLLVGNSSSAIMESPSLGLPAVDIGERQRGRTRAANVLHADPTTEAIIAAMKRARNPDFRNSLRGLANPYGDGHASERIVTGLAAAPSFEVLLHKRALTLDPTHMAFCQESENSTRAR
ncbi:MAG: UDP-N-acetylglucosamine 2-epimerase [Gammaproteobacteria bacterium]|nr:UDP-N-acetylglucosamine 2-epimerase [Gammaproteobacteria bacterium]